MKQYIFHLNAPMEPQEVKIEATGMFDALNQAKELQLKTMEESSSKVDMQFKGTIYSH